VKKITIVSPCYNEEENVLACYEAVKLLFENDLSGYEREHIFSDNCSADRTAEILREIAGGDTKVKVIFNARNFGPFRSLFNGLRYATGDAIIVFLPVDLQDPPELIPEFVRHWENGIEVVAGARINRSETRLMRFCRWSFYRIVNGLSDFEIPPDVGEFQLIDRKVWEAVVSYQDHYPYIRGIIASCGFKRLIIPYTWRTRQRGLSKNNIWSLIDQAFNGIFSFTNAPMRFCTLSGFVLALLCLIYAVGSLVAYIFLPHMAPRGTTTIIFSIFFLSAVQLIFIGILGEYVTSTHSQVRKGPIVIERDRINIDAIG
jgi:glycosyltransferase involved in cell wall biosynthesis